MSGGFEDMAEACEIFQKYSDGEKWPFHCEYDVLHVCGVEPEDVNEEDKERLHELGFFVMDGRAFASYRFGSC